MTKRFGFTLAEVLITLGIIGVVAAMTIPTVLSNVSDQQYRTGFKKIMSTLNQAVTMNFAINNQDFSDAVTTTTDSASVYKMLTDRMNVIKTGYGATSVNAGASNYTLYFNDGMAVNFPAAIAACTTTTSTNCKVIVDVNGDKKPNTMTTQATQLKDQFVVRFVGQQVQAHGPAESLLYK